VNSEISSPNFIKISSVLTKINVKKNSVALFLWTHYRLKSLRRKASIACVYQVWSTLWTWYPFTRKASFSLGVATILGQCSCPHYRTALVHQIMYHKTGFFWCRGCDVRAENGGWNTSAVSRFDRETSECGTFLKRKCENWYQPVLLTITDPRSTSVNFAHVIGPLSL